MVPTFGKDPSSAGPPSASDSSPWHEFEPQQRLCWSANGPGVLAYHGWLLVPSGGGGTTILTEETQIGEVARFAGDLEEKLVEQHDIWLTTLGEEAAKLAAVWRDSLAAQRFWAAGEHDFSHAVRAAPPARPACYT